jgi:chromosome partitioning protein
MFDVPEVGDDAELQPDDLDNVSRETPQFPHPSTTRIMVVANQKGGVGKTTSAVNLAVGLARGGLKTLVIDIDPQGNASTALGVEHSEGTPGTYEALGGQPMKELLVNSPESPLLWVLPATIDLAGAELELASRVARENQLRNSLNALLAEVEFDYVFIDCPPSLGLLTLNAFVAARELLIPIQCEFYALEGLTQLLKTIDIIRTSINARLDVSTVLLTMFDVRTKLSQQVADEVRRWFPHQTLNAVIPRSVRVAEAPSYSSSVLSYHEKSAGAQAYLDAAAEIAARAK